MCIRDRADHLKGIDVVVCTAAVPGRPAPKIISEAMVAGMKPGSVVVDLAAETGGNCALTQPGQTIESGGVTIAGPVSYTHLDVYKRQAAMVAVGCRDRDKFGDAQWR